MNYLRSFFKNLPTKSRVLVILFFIMAVGFITFLLSPLILIWGSWALAWKVGATGLCFTILPFIGWWFIFCTYAGTVNKISGYDEE